MAQWARRTSACRRSVGHRRSAPTIYRAREPDARGSALPAKTDSETHSQASIISRGHGSVATVGVCCREVIDAAWVVRVTYIAGGFRRASLHGDPRGDISRSVAGFDDTCDVAGPGDSCRRIGRADLSPGLRDVPQHRWPWLNRECGRVRAAVAQRARPHRLHRVRREHRRAAGRLDRRRVSRRAGSRPRSAHAGIWRCAVSRPARSRRQTHLDLL